MRYPYAPGSEAAHAAAVAAIDAPPPSGAPKPLILRPSQPYDLSTPGTPAGIVAVAKAAEQGASLPPPGGWRHEARFALAQETEADGGGIAASLSLRLTGDLPGRPRRAWVAYVRRADGRWQPNGCALLDGGDAERPMRVLGVEELKAMLRGEVWTPPAPRPVPMLACQGCDRVVRFSTTTWRPYANHRCNPTTTTEGRS